MDKIEVTQADYDAAQAFFRDERTGLAVKFQLGAEPQPLLEAFARHRRATEARAQGLVEALTASALRFREYEASHAAKGNLDGDAKARRNCEMAEQCEQALATWRRT